MDLSAVNVMDEQKYHIDLIIVTVWQLKSPTKTLPIAVENA